MTTSSATTSPLLGAAPAATAARPWRFRFGCLHVLCTYVLLIWGGLVTSHDAGLAVPDWPTSYGNWFFVQMIGNVFYEHGHRLVAEFVGLLTIVYAVWLWRTESRRWLRWWGVALLFTVCLQGVLGGITVKLFTPPAVSMMHGTLAQAFFCLSIGTAYFISGEWAHTRRRAETAATLRLRRACLGAGAAVFAQLVLGTAVRKTGAVLLTEDSPPLTLATLTSTWPVLVHGLHWIGAAVVVVFVGRLLGVVVRHHRADPRCLRPVLLVAALVAAQLGLGLWTVLSATRPSVATAHVVTGALILGCVVFVTLRSYREERA